MALTADEFEELKSLIGASAKTETPKPLPATGAGGGRGAYLTGVTSPNQFIAAQRAAQQEQALAKEKAALEEEGFLGYTARRGLDVLTGRGQGNLVSGLLTGPTGLINRIAAPLGSQQAQKEMAAAQSQAEREKQLEKDLYGDRSFVEKVGAGLQNVAGFAAAEPTLFASQVGQQLFDPANIALGAIGAPVRGAGALTNIARAAGGGVIGAGVPAAATSFAQGGLDAERAAEEAATGGVLSAGLYGAGRAVGAFGSAVGRPVQAVKDIVSTLKEPIPKPIAELITADRDIASTFDDVAELKKFYGKDFNPNLAEITKEIAVIDRAKTAAQNDVDAIKNLRASRTALEDSFTAKLNSAFPASDNVLDTLGKDFAKKSRIEESVISAQEDALKKQTARFKEMGGQSPLELGESARQLRDSIKDKKRKYWDGVFTKIKQIGDEEKISMSPDNVEQLYTATKNIPVSVFDSFDPVTQRAIRELNRYIDVAEDGAVTYGKVPFSVLHDYSNAINREYSNVYTAASMGSADARVMLNQVKAAKTALDNGLSTLPGKFGDMYKEVKAKYGSDFMGLFYEGFGGQLGKRNRFGESIQDSDVAAKLVSKPEYINDFIRLNDNSPLAQQAVTEALIQKFLKTESVINADGSIKADKLNAFIGANADAFKFVPSARETFTNLRDRIQSYVESKAAAELRKAEIADTALSLIHI